MQRIIAKKLKKAAQVITCFRFSPQLDMPILPQNMQQGENSHTGETFINFGLAGSVYSFETCRKHVPSGFTVGAQNPPQRGRL
jgi:hypothetical protein